MENIMNIDPGLIIWTLINFGIFLFIILKVGTKPILKGLSDRENSISSQIGQAEKANADAQELLKSIQAKLDSAQIEVNQLISKGKEQAEQILTKASEEATKARLAQVEDAKRQIERSKELALKELRTQVAGMVIEATEKILEEKLDKDTDYKLVESYINKISDN